MKKVSEAERCEATFEFVEGNFVRCSKRANHFGKHVSLDDGWVGWTDQGKARVLAERAEAEKKQQ